MNSRRMWNLVRVVVAVSLVLQSVVSFAVIPVSAKLGGGAKCRAVCVAVGDANDDTDTGADAFTRAGDFDADRIRDGSDCGCARRTLVGRR